MYSMDYREAISDIVRSIFNSLGTGFDKEIYQNALNHALLKHNMIRASRIIPIQYENQTVGTLTIDVIQYRVGIVLEVGSNIHECMARCLNAKRLANLPYGMVCIFPSTLQQDLIIEFV